MTALATTRKIQAGSPEALIEIFAKAAVIANFPIEDQFGNPNLGRFILENGRLPKVDDEVKPWSYRGWIIPYIQLCEEHPSIAPRYAYVEKIIENGCLPDEPIPQVAFIHERSKDAADGMKMLHQMIKIVENRTGYHRSIESICEWLGYGLGVTTKPSELHADDQEKLYRLFDVSKWLLNPTDYLGEAMAEIGHGKAGGFFPTPMNICTMMAAMTYGDGDHRLKTVMDPCVGTGRLLLAASNYSLRMFGMDINYVCVLVTKINMALYAPWSLIPETIFPKLDTPESVLIESAPNYFATEVEQPSLF